VPGCFIDTTVLVHAARRDEPMYSQARRFAEANLPALLADYALRELFAGVIQILCDAHNRVLAADNAAEATASILRLASFAARTSVAKAVAISDALSRALGGAAPRTPMDMKREVLQDLMVSAARLWRNAQRVQFFEQTQPLSCFGKGDIAIDAATSALRGPGDSFGCLRKERCAAALYMFEHKEDIGRLIEALHPDKLSPVLANKQESKSRRKALKELVSRGPKDFRKNYCRALGDAYFALMCPPGSIVLSTNLQDYDVLCGALNKEVRTP